MAVDADPSTDKRSAGKNAVAAVPMAVDEPSASKASKAADSATVAVQAPMAVDGTDSDRKRSGSDGPPPILPMASASAAAATANTLNVLQELGLEGSDDVDPDIARGNECTCCCSFVVLIII